MKKNLKKVAFILLGILICWMALTLWAEYSGGKKIVFIGSESSPKKALIVYNPDPIYNFDERISKSFAEGLSEQNFYVKIATVKSAQKDSEDFDCYVFCANTYNWAPDWLVKDYIINHSNLKGKNVVAITLGSGSTQRAKRKLEETLDLKGAQIMKSETFWLMKPNDENRMHEGNIVVATDMAKDLGYEIGEELNNTAKVSSAAQRAFIGLRELKIDNN